MNQSVCIGLCAADISRESAGDRSVPALADAEALAHGYSRAASALANPHPSENIRSSNDTGNNPPSYLPKAASRGRPLGVRKRPFAWNAGKRLRPAMSRHRRFRMDGPVAVSTYCPSRAPEPALAVCIVRCVSHMGLRLSLSKSRVSSRTRANRVFLRGAAADKHGVGLRVNSAGARGSHRVGCSPWIPTRAETAAWATSVSAAPSASCRTCG
jgi:hypothetical protein